VRLYLSSFLMGDHPGHLLALTGQDSRRAVVIANAMDDAPPDVRRTGVDLELAALAGLGLDAAELDLRGYYRSPGHPETAAIERVVARYRADGIPYRALRDGQALLINGPQKVIV
jgi:dipeptidase E